MLVVMFFLLDMVKDTGFLGPFSWVSSVKVKKTSYSYMDVSENNGIPKSSILIGFCFINHPFWGFSLFLETPICTSFCFQIGKGWFWGTLLF